MKRSIAIIISCVVILIALGIVLYPLVSNYVNDKYQSVLQTNYDETVQDMDAMQRELAMLEAKEYNENLSPILFSGDRVETQDYERLLDPEGSGVMAYIEIPNISVELPIYHTDDAEILEKGIGHIEGTALPVGGEGCHCVLTGHSGVAGKRLFSDIDKLTEEDVFYIHVLNNILAYEVTDINTVLPYETQYLEPVEGEDLCTLVTCTPFGVNTHRLLVKGSRIPYAEAQVLEEQEQPAESTWKQQYVHGLLLGGAVLVGMSLLILVAMLLWRKHHEKE